MRPSVREKSPHGVMIALLALTSTIWIGEESRLKVGNNSRNGALITSAARTNTIYSEEIENECRRQQPGRCGDVPAAVTNTT